MLPPESNFRGFFRVRPISPPDFSRIKSQYLCVRKFRDSKMHVFLILLILKHGENHTVLFAII